MTWRPAERLASIIALSLLASFGCRTPYQRQGRLGGYSDYQAGTDAIYVSYAGNGFTDASTIIRYWHLRAAEVCGGSDKYEVLARTDRSTTEVGASRSTFNGSATTHGNYTTYSGTAVHSAPITVTKLTAEGYVRCVNGGAYDSSRQVWDKRGNANSSAAPVAAGLRPPSEEDGLSYQAPESTEREPLNSESPTGAMGYVLGASRATVEEACRAANRELSIVSADVVRCSGPAPEFGSDAVVLLRLCEGDSLCQIDVSFPPYGAAFHQWFKRYDEVSRALANTYGRPSSEVRRLTTYCERTYLACFASGAARYTSIWQWESGAAIKLASGRTDSYIHVNYFSAQGLAAQAATSDERADPDPASPYRGL